MFYIGNELRLLFIFHDQQSNFFLWEKEFLFEEMFWFSFLEMDVYEIMYQ